MKLKNKHTSESLNGVVVFLILNALFFSLMIFFVARATTGAAIIEKDYSQKIAFTIDSMKPGTEVEIDISKLYDAAEKNNFKEDIFIPDYENSTITIKVASGEGNSFRYFTKLEYGALSINSEREIIIIKT